MTLTESIIIETLSEMAGTKIENQLQLIKMVKELSMEKNTYIKVNESANIGKSHTDMAE
ncbi:MAG: stage IV sporulation protein A [Eubacterium ventriosum]